MPVLQPRQLTYLCLLALWATSLPAQDWAQWRGPRWDGSSPARNLPTQFDQTTKVRWRTPMVGPSEATPVILGDRVFLTSTDPATESLLAICLDRVTGKPHWIREAGSGFQPEGKGSKLQLDGRSTYASPSPIAAPERVIFFFGNGDLVAYDLQGELLWRRNLQRDHGVFSFQWTFSATPTLIGDRLVLPILQRNIPAGARAATEEPIESFLLGLDPATGETRYRHVRPSPAEMESLESYTTMVPWKPADGAEELLLVGGDVITGHDPRTGAETWRWGTWNEGHRERWWRIVPSPVVGEGVVLICAPKRAPVHAVTLGGRGSLAADAVAWKSEGRPNDVSSDVPTPAFDAGHFFVLSDVQNALSKVEARSGKIVWTTRLPKDHLWRASPTVADGKVYLMNHGGQVFVLDAAGGAILHRAEMGEPGDDRICSSIAVAHGALFIRTNSALFCVAEPPAEAPR